MVIMMMMMMVVILMMTEVSQIQQEDSPIPLFKAVAYSSSWVRKLVNTAE